MDSRPTAKRARLENMEVTDQCVVGGIDLTALPENISADAIQDILNAADEFEVDTITEGNIKRVVNQFQLHIQRNEEQRLKFPDDPEKFLKSEVDLDEDINRLKGVAISVSLLSTFIDEEGIEMLVPLLHHANTDLAGSVLTTLIDITSPDIIMELNNSESFIKRIIDSGCPSFLGELLVRLNETTNDDDYQIVTNALQVVDNLIEIHPVLVSEVFTTKSPKFIPWLLRRVRTPSDNKSAVCYNRCFATELLAIILQTSFKCRQSLGLRPGLDGVEKLLRCLAVYRKRDPNTAEEEEYVGNVTDCLAALLQEAENRNMFGTVSGLELMIRLLRDRMKVYPHALKLTMYALENNPENCKLFVEKLGLKSLFGIFMKRGVRTKLGSTQDREEDEYCIASILYLCRSTTGAASARLLNKFTENKCEKLERLLELHQKYFDLMKNYSGTRSKRSNVDDIIDNLELNVEDVEYLDRCEAGLFTLQSVDNIIVRLANMGNILVRQRIHWLLDIKGISIDEVYSVLTAYLGRLNTSATEKPQLSSFLHHFLEGSETLM